MARGQIKAGGLGLGLNIEMSELEQTSRIFKDARNRIARDLREVMAVVATDVVVPAARRRAGRLRTKRGRVGASIVARKGTGNAIYLTTSQGGKAGAVIGLFEFGGTVRAPIRPRAARRRRGGHAPAVMTPFGPRAAVLGPRHYHAHHFLEHARDEQLTAYGREVRDQIVTRFAPLEIR